MHCLPGTCSSSSQELFVRHLITHQVRENCLALARLCRLFADYARCVFRLSTCTDSDSRFLDDSASSVTTYPVDREFCRVRSLSSFVLIAQMRGQGLLT